MTEAVDADDGLTSVRKAFDIIETLWDLEGATLSELSDGLDIPPSTVHIHLKTLRTKGYVTKDEQDIYQLSLRFFTFGEYVRSMHPLSEAAPDAVENLAQQTGERVLCMTEQYGIGTILEVCEVEQSIRTDVGLGANAYLHCSAGGKAILAKYPEARVHEILDKWGLPKWTEHTITDRTELMAELEHVRNEDGGIAVAREEYFEGVLTVAAPIVSHGTVYGSLVVLGPSERLYKERNKSQLHENLLAATNTIEVNLRLDEAGQTG